MMREEAAAYQVEALVAEGKSQRIGDQRTMPSGKPSPEMY